MPGLAGFTLGTYEPAEAVASLARMRSLLAHGESRSEDELFCDGRVCATRTHTGIVQREPQPHAEGGVRVWLDGEFYNREELARTLGGGEEFASDAALLAALYRRDGDFDFLKAIDGIYSAVIYDEPARRVHLVSDRYGLRHLFWTTHAGGLAWASEVKAMLALPGFEPEVDRAALQDFFEFGQLTGDRTWFEGVELLPSGTVLTWDEDARTTLRRRYWWWDDIKPLEGSVDEDELARELGRLFRASVERRARTGGRVGLTLSGGLDSRVILAAMPEGGAAVHAVTFGKRGCDDVRIAAQAARVRGAEHHVTEMSSEGWLAPRLGGVWATDGQLNLMHMHVAAAAPLVRQLFDVNLDGFLGDATIGGSYIGSHGRDVIGNLDSRGRRFISLGPAALRPFAETRLPFFDNQFLELAMSAPESLRKDSCLYHKMLLLTFPEYFRDIPWQSTGAPITWPRREASKRSLLGEKRERLIEVLDYYGLRLRPARSYADYANWLRREPARSFCGALLGDASALYADYVPRERAGAVLASHMKGRDRSEELGRFITFEIWLRQVFLSEYREAGAQSLKLAAAR
ncbi:MAG: hypothetical protein QOH49_4155 [Acidobacteriota bacterium]|jgi:asparagine synthase (glutamine-hydrolysing)|nr:hypothetical protein [Acidobacteriota bacterium]